MIVRVSEVPEGGFGGSVVVFDGLSVDGDQAVRFGVDHRMADGLAEAIQEQGEVDCQVESWQILSRATA